MSFDTPVCKSSILQVTLDFELKFFEYYQL